jgi:hypothetical protein
MVLGDLRALKSQQFLTQLAGDRHLNVFRNCSGIVSLS